MSTPRTDAPRTRADFIARWRGAAMILGMDALSTLKAPPDARGGPETKANMLLALPEKIDGLLGRMYDDMTRPAPPSNGAVANGQAVKGATR